MTALQITSPLGQPWNDYTDSHDVIISLVIIKNRTYLLCPSSGHIRRRCAFVDNFDIVTNKLLIKSSISALEFQCCSNGSDWAVS